MKIIFHVGESIDSHTIVRKGNLYGNTQQLYIEYKGNQYFLNNIQSVKLYSPNGLFSMVKIENNNDTVFLCVPRIFIDIGTGFVLNNTVKTAKVKQMLELVMEHQKLNKR